MVNLHEGMSPEAQEIAKATHIASGWIPWENLQSQRYICGCEICGFSLEEVVSDFKIEHANFDVKRHVEVRVMAQAYLRSRIYECRHWSGFSQLTDTQAAADYCEIHLNRSPLQSLAACANVLVNEEAVHAQRLSQAARWQNRESVGSHSESAAREMRNDKG